MQITSDGTFKEIELQKKITTLGPSKEADLFFPATKNDQQYFQIVEKNKNFQILGLTPHSYFLHEGKKKQNMDLSTYEVFEIENSKFIFSKKPFRPKPDNQDALTHYQTFYRFSQALSELYQSNLILKKLLDLILDISKAQKGFLLSIEDRKAEGLIEDELKIVASRAMQEKLIQNSLEDLSKKREELRIRAAKVFLISKCRIIFLLMKKDLIEKNRS